MPSTLLTSLIDIGEQLCDAAAADDWDAFLALMDERAALIDRLRAFDHPSEVDARWEQQGEVLARQHERLNRALTGRKEHLQRALVHVEKLKEAQAHYGQAPTARTPVLRENVRG